MVRYQERAQEHVRRLQESLKSPLKDIDKARLVPELDFRPARLNTSGDDAMKIGNAGSLGSEHS